MVTDLDEAMAVIERYPTVIKADGLAAGKGVVIAQDEGAAREALQALLVERRFGTERVVVEEHLEGDELSLLALCDGERGGGDGAGPGLQADLRRRPRARTPAAWGRTRPCPGSGPTRWRRSSAPSTSPWSTTLARRGMPFHGVLYAGLMLTSAGPRCSSSTCRFGDPETQAVLPRLRSDLLDVLAARHAAGRAGRRDA